MKDKKGPTRAQLQRKIEKLEIANARLHKLLEGDSLRREGEHWYELLEYFDAEKIERVQIPGAPARTFAMGYLDDALVLQVPKDETAEAVQAFRDMLKNNNLKVPFLVITENVRFVRLGTVSEELEARLDATQIKKDEDDAEESSGTTGDLPAGDGSEPDGDGLGDCGPSAGEDRCSGGDSDGEGEADRTADGSAGRSA